MNQKEETKKRASLGSKKQETFKLFLVMVKTYFC